MSYQYVGEIRLFAGNFPPAGWLLCNGQTVPISQFETLYELIGTTYGGDGQTTFALPDLRGRVPVHQGRGALDTYAVGETGGVESVTLTTQQVPAHTHGFAAGGAATTATPAGNVFAAASTDAYAPANSPAPVQLAAQALDASGGNQPHDNMAPFLAVNFIIATTGIFPSQT